LVYQVDAITAYLEQKVPGSLPEPLQARAHSLGNAGIPESELDPAEIIFARVNEVRWRLSGLDPDNLPSSGKHAHPKEAIEEAWSTTALAHRKARLATIEAALEELWTRQRITTITTGEKDPSILEQIEKLGEEKTKLALRGGSSSWAGWGGWPEGASAG
jgi:hypothetical protein